MARGLLMAPNMVSEARVVKGLGHQGTLPGTRLRVPRYGALPSNLTLPTFPCLQAADPGPSWREGNAT